MIKIHQVSKKRQSEETGYQITGSKTATDDFVLRDLSLTVSKGEVVLISGPTGSGKSLLLSLLHGKIIPESGSVHLLGHPLDRLQRNSLPLLRRVIGYVPQEIRLLERRSIQSNIELGPKACGQHRLHVRLHGKNAMEAMDLVSVAKVKAYRATTGQRRRTMIARSLATRPPIFLADEPTGGLDDDHCTSLLNAVSELAQKGGAAVISTRDPRLLERGWSRGWRCTELREGQIVESSMQDMFKKEVKKSKVGAVSKERPNPSSYVADVRELAAELDLWEPETTTASKDHPFV